MTTAIVTIDRAATLHSAGAAVRRLGRRTALVAVSIFYLVVMAYLLMAVMGSGADTRSATGPQASPAPAPIVHPAPDDNGPISVPARPLSGFEPR